MGLLHNTTNREYYQGNNLGNYQFTSLDHIITQFQIAYVGEGKIIPKVKRADVVFHAQRALQELSFDTFKSIKAQEITLPPSLTMILPQDYVGYTKLSWVDSSGIKHPLIKTNSTSNPFSIKQEDNGDYFFESNYVNIVNGDFDQSINTGWNISNGDKSGAWDGISSSVNYPQPIYLNDTVGIVSEQLEFSSLWTSQFGGNLGRSYGAWQHIDVSSASSIDLSVNGSSAAKIVDGSTTLCGFGILRVGFTTTNPAMGWLSKGTSSQILPATFTSSQNPTNPSPNQYAEYLDVGYLEWDDGTASTKELNNIDVSGLNEIWVYVQSQAPWTAAAATTLTNTASSGAAVWSPTSAVNITPSKNSVDSISITVPEDGVSLTSKNKDNNSDTWSNYKSQTPSENNNEDYEDDVYWPMNGQRYGLDPQHAQVNGSFYIDNTFGKINFSSNIAGRTVVLDYISDSLGTDGEMQVHKFAEEAMYKCIAYAIISTSSSQLLQQLAPRFKKERFAEIRKAKIRLSSLKLEELAQTLRGKSKQIKH